MPADVNFFADKERTQPFGMVALGQVTVDDGLKIGDACPIYGKNTGDTKILELAVEVSGEGAKHIQLAVDNDGEPDVWAVSDNGIIIGDVESGEDFVFWARAQYNFEDIEGIYDFDFVLRGVSA
jgi:hypothetical protein